MPTPVGHSLVGTAIFIVSGSRNDSIRIKELILYVFVSILPDFDFIPGIFVGDLNYFHHGVSHSIGLAILIALIASRIFKFDGDISGKNFLIFFSLYMSHIILDFFTVDRTPPIGEKILWPLSNNYYLSPFTPFMGVRHNNFEALFSFHNIRVILYEIFLFLPLNLLLLFVKRVKVNFMRRSER